MSPARATVIVTACAALSRILGFLRDVLLTQFLGTGPAADAFLAAFRLPNALRRIVSEGGFNPAFIPLYLRLRNDSGPAAREFARQTCLAWGCLLVIITLVAEIAAGPIMLFLAGGLPEQTFTLSVFFFRLLFPLVLGGGLASLLSAVLNAERKVVITSLAPLSFNLAIITAIVASQISDLNPVRSGFWIAIACGLSGFLHLAIMALALRDSGLLRGIFSMSLAATGKSANLRTFTRLVVPALAATGAIQLFPIAASQIASGIPSAVSWFYYADRLFQLPAGFIAAAAGIVMLPRLAGHFSRSDRRACDHIQNRALENALLFSLPAAAGLACLALPITAVLFQRGAFSANDSLETSRMLLILSLSLPFAVMGKVFASTVFALGKIRIAIAAGVAGLAVTFVSALLFTRLFSAPGIAIGTSLGFVTHFLLLMLTLWYARLWSPDMRLAMRGLRIVIATVIMVLVLAALAHFIEPATIAGVAIHCLSGAVIYAVAAWLCGAVSRRDIRRYLRR